MSAPFSDQTFTFTQPNGDTFEVKGTGDQYYAVFETLDGYTVIQDPKTGFYEIASLSKDGDELEPSGRKPGDFDPANSKLPRHTRINPLAAKAKAMEEYRRMEGALQMLTRQKSRNIAPQVMSMAPGVHSAPPPTGIRGDYMGLCLLIEFSDDPATISQEDVEAFCNEQGYSGYGNNGSVYDYFFDNSDGLLRYKNIVVSYYRAEHPKTYYCDESVSYGSRARQLIKEAVDNLRTKGFDFSQITADDRGYIYGTNVFYTGNRQNNWSKGLWPHKSQLYYPHEAGPGRSVLTYQITNMGQSLTLGTFCHENGHSICGLPDLYDYGYESRGIGVYCLMCGGGHGKNPVQLCGYLKHCCGWGEITTIEHGQEVTLSSNRNEFAIFHKNEKEYFLIENRKNQGRDKNLPTSGLAIWHVDVTGSNNNEQMGPVIHYECSLEQADNQFDLEKKKNSGDPNDLFSASGNNRFADQTGPNSKWWDGTSSKLDIYDISDASDTMSFKVRLTENETSMKSYIRKSEPGIEIPDNDVAGIRDTITFPEKARISSVKVNLNIAHTYKGDLQIDLLAPFAESIVLHNRLGGNRDNIESTFDTAAVPELSTLSGKELQGDWSLVVKDLAKHDTGVLNSWELEIQGLKREVIQMEEILLEESPGIIIPDDKQQGIQRQLVSNETGLLKNIAVSLDISHTFIQDLHIRLVSPSGKSVSLHQNAGGEEDNILKTYTPDTIPELNRLVGEPVQGNWELSITDNARHDVGKLNKWGLLLFR